MSDKQESVIDKIYLIGTIKKLFLKTKFWAHRALGMLYLLQWVYSFYLYFKDYETYRDSKLYWTLPLTGVLQTITAMFYFRFLPSTDDPGYYSDKSVMSYKFVCENLFYAGLLFFQFLYMSVPIYKDIKEQPFFEHLFVFLPYAVLRPLFPKTRFRDSLKNVKNKTDKNKIFFIIGTNITRVFYMWAKHYIGFFLNYLRYMDKLSASEIKELHFLLIMSCFATTISLFLHTLKFKGYMGPKLAFFLYMASYLLTFYSFVQIAPVFIKELDITLITLFGLIINYPSAKIHAVYQVFVMILFYYRREQPNIIPYQQIAADYGITIPTF